MPLSLSVSIPHSHRIFHSEEDAKLLWKYGKNIDIGMVRILT